MAALNWPFSSQDVNNMFHPNEAMPHNLQTMYNDVSGLGTWGAGKELRDFDGFGRAEADTLTPQQQSCSGGNVTVRMRGDVTFVGDGSMEYRFKYDTSFDFPSPSYTTWQSTSTTGTKTEDVSGFSIGDDVYVKIQYRNSFNDVAGAEDEDPLEESVTLTKSALATPSIISTAAPGLVDIYVEFSCDSNFGDVQYNWKESSTKPDASEDGTQITTFNCENDLGTATAEASLQTNGYNTPSNVWIKIKLNGNACYNDSAWSDWTNADGSMSDPCI